MTIRPCSFEDIPVLLQVSIQSYREHYLHLWYDNGKKYMDDNFNYQVFKSQLEDKNVVLFLICDEQKSPVGFLKLNIDKAWQGYDEASSLELERIYLIRNASGKGLGSSIIDFVANFAKLRNKKYVWVKSMDSGPGVNF